jgi:hypothetical protein
MVMELFVEACTMEEHQLLSCCSRERNVFAERSRCLPEESGGSLMDSKSRGT